MKRTSYDYVISLTEDAHGQRPSGPVHRALAAAGVKRIYGIVGDRLNGLTDAVHRHGKIEWLHIRHAEVAACAAGAEAHLTGELAVPQRYVVILSGTADNHGAPVQAQTE